MRIPKVHEERLTVPEPLVTERLDLEEIDPQYYLAAITRSESKRQHIAGFFDFEQDDMGELEEDDIDEALQIKALDEPIPEPTIEGPE